MSVALALVALILGVIEIIRSRSSSLIAWAVTSLALSYVWPLTGMF